MYENRIQYALDCFIEENYFLSMSNQYRLEEKKDTGRSDLEVTIENTNLCISDFDGKKKCNFLRPDKTNGMQKSVDHIIFEEKGNGWKAHLIEMKSSVGAQTWNGQIKPKVRTSYLTSLALAVFLGIRVDEVEAYTTFENDKFSDSSDQTNPKLLVAPLGKPVYNPAQEWEDGVIHYDFGEDVEIKHHKIQMVRNSNTGVLEGDLVLDEE